MRCVTIVNHTRYFLDCDQWHIHHQAPWPQMLLQSRNTYHTLLYSQGLTCTVTYHKVSPDGLTKSVRLSYVTRIALFPQHSTWLTGPSMPTICAIQQWRDLQKQLIYYLLVHIFQVVDCRNYYSNWKQDSHTGGMAAHVWSGSDSLTYIPLLSPLMSNIHMSPIYTPGLTNVSSLLLSQSLISKSVNDPIGVTSPFTWIHVPISMASDLSKCCW